MYKPLPSLATFIAKQFILFDVIVNENVFLISFLDSLLLEDRNATEMCAHCDPHYLTSVAES